MGNENQTQTYYAQSVLTDPTAILATLLALIQIPEAATLMLEYGVNPKLINFIVAAATLVARIAHAQRPVAFIPPANVKPVEVKKLEPTMPPDGGK